MAIDRRLIAGSESYGRGAFCTTTFNLCLSSSQLSIDFSIGSDFSGRVKTYCEVRTANVTQCAFTTLSVA